ncbi:hypothetical protein HELRODRAFT_177939 [Helobdella robusta]|uniref:Uncharacterized protein n=1 Tax=Helobdella robusta TaxID=6412 RepID=T1FCH9_HELRO|nr:hypothetical protein HELRODRAFT_177939 [Helobdella robusta]ESN97510.1 hypothetical protein HELRODRAFT_177939 [Helobdella robusta]
MGGFFYGVYLWPPFPTQMTLLFFHAWCRETYKHITGATSSSDLHRQSYHYTQTHFDKRVGSDYISWWWCGVTLVCIEFLAMDSTNPILYRIARFMDKFESGFDNFKFLSPE